MSTQCGEIPGLQGEISFAPNINYISGKGRNDMKMTKKTRKIISTVIVVVLVLAMVVPVVIACI